MLTRERGAALRGCWPVYRVIRFVDDLIDRVLALILILVLLIGVYFIYDTAYVFYHASAARVAYYRPGSEEAAEAAETKPLTEDYVAWLTLDDTNIDYPVMQGENNSKYLNMDPYGEYSLAGSIFLDSRNAGDFSDSYSLLYGHHMSGGYMFGALDRFYDKNYFETHRSGSLRVGGVDYPLTVFAVLQTDASEDAVFNPQGSEKVLQTAKEASMYYREPEDGRVIALSTCKDPGSTTRTVVLCTLSEG